MNEPTRPLPPLTPLPHGGWEVYSFLSSVEYRIRGLGLRPPSSVVPVIFVPGIMGTNLRARTKPILASVPDQRNKVLKPGEPAWRPPNSTPGGLLEAGKWLHRQPDARQKMFDPATVEVDDSGPPHIPHGDGRYHVDRNEAQQRGWGEVHSDSYIGLLCALETRLNHTFWRERPEDERRILKHWKDVMAFAPRKWGERQRHIEPLTEAELEKHARHHYPVYAVGYNWLSSSSESSERLEQRVLEIIEYWKGLKRQCDKVILVTHSMGGLVARACAKRIPDKIAGVIHGVMPALGAPVCYRRMACGMETNSPSNGWIENIEADVLAAIAGPSAAHTTPVMGIAPGPLELLPNHLYPGPWLYANVQPAGPASAQKHGVDYLSLPSGAVSNPYDLYRDLTSWYRVINPAWIGSDETYRSTQGDAERAIKKAIGAAERFHRSLGDYYHPNTYAFYGNDSSKLSFGRVRWVGRRTAGTGPALTPSSVGDGLLLAETGDVKGGRYVSVEGYALRFEPEPQDSLGDGTVPHQSGAGPAGKVRQLFETSGYTHQGSYNNEDMLNLTLHLIVKIAKEIP